MRLKNFLLVVFVMIYVFINSVSAASLNGDCGDAATYTLFDNVLTIVGTGIVDNDDGWIDYYEVVDTLIVSEGIEELDSRMFDGFEVLSTVTLPSTLTTIGARTFRDCISLESIIIPDSVNSISSNSFSGCDNLVIYCSSGSYAEEYAQTNSITYKIISEITISFDANGGENAPSALNGSMTDKFTLPFQMPKKNDYIFVGWSINQEATEAIYKAGDTVNFTEDTTLYAVWMTCNFIDSSTENIIIINSNVTSPKLDLYIAAYGDDNRLLDVIVKPVELNPGENIIETGVDWSNLNKNTVKAFLWDKNLMPYTNSINLKLTQNHNVIFKDWDGTILSQQSIITGGNAIEPSTPTREGYEFCGWNRNYTNITTDTVLTAQYVDSSLKNAFKVFSTEGQKGESIKVAVYLGGLVETCGFDMRLKYDSTALELISIDNDFNLDIIANHVPEDSFVKFNYGSSKNRTKSAKILEVEFKIKETVKNSTIINLIPIEIIRADSTQDNIPVDAEYNLIEGVVTIK